MALILLSTCVCCAWAVFELGALAISYTAGGWLKDWQVAHGAGSCCMGLAVGAWARKWQPVVQCSCTRCWPPSAHAALMLSLLGWLAAQSRQWCLAAGWQHNQAALLDWLAGSAVQAPCWLGAGQPSTLSEPAVSFGLRQR